MMFNSSNSLSSSTIRTPVKSHSRSSSNAEGQSIMSDGAATLVAEQSGSQSTFKLPDVDNVILSEATPLLGGKGDIHTSDASSTGLKEAWVLMQYAAPIICGSLLQYSFNVVSVVSIGHLSTTMLAGSALASLTVSVTANSIIQGFAAALDSLLPQAWTSEHPTHVGLWTQRMMVLMTFIIMPIFALWQNAEPILLYLRQDPEVARLAALYLRFISFQLPGCAFNAVTRRYFQAQGLLHVPAMINIIVAPINVALNFLLVRGPEPIRLGFIGAPIATSISVTLTSVLYLVYGLCFAPRTAWHPITSQSFTSLPKLFCMGFVGAVQTAAEWWSWEFMSLAVSQLGPAALAAQSVIMVVATIMYHIPYSVGVAAAVRTGNFLGSGNARQAYIAARAATGLALLGGVVLGLTVFSLRHKITYAFINDEQVSLLVASVIPIVSLYQIVDGLASVEGGILRACGKLGVSATLNFAAYYVIGLPLGISLAFWGNLGLQGIWIGLATAVFCAALALWSTVLRLDWNIQVLEAKERIKAGASPGVEHVPA